MSRINLMAGQVLRAHEANEGSQPVAPRWRAHLKTRAAAQVQVRDHKQRFAHGVVAPEV